MDFGQSASQTPFCPSCRVDEIYSQSFSTEVLWLQSWISISVIQPFDAFSYILLSLAAINRDTLEKQKMNYERSYTEKGPGVYTRTSFSTAISAMAW